jgi:26S proteasome regulatory subunit N12
VVDFARARGWIVKDGTIYFPSSSSSTSGGATGLGLVGEEGLLGPAATTGGFGADKEGEKELSLQVIENTLGYARQLETIV